MANENGKLRIAVWHNLPSGGSSRALHEHIKGLYQRGHEIELWTNPLADVAYLNVQHFVKKIHTVHLIHTFTSTFTDKCKSIFFVKNTATKEMEKHCQICAEQINTGNFDVLFASTCYFYAAPFISRFVTIPKLLYLGEPFRFFYEASPRFRWEAPTINWANFVSTKIWRTFLGDLWSERSHRVLVREERLNYEAFDKVLVNSYYSSESCIKAYGKAPEVCYLGINTELFKPLHLERTSFVMGVGNFYPNKNPMFAIKALSLVPPEKRPTLIWVANMSDEKYCEENKKIAEHLGVELVLKKMISDEELLMLFNTASLFIYTSILEPFGLAPLEANACGLPVVAIAEAGVRETIIHQKNGLLTTRKPQEMADAIIKLLSDKPLWQQLSNNAIEQVNTHWSLEKSTDSIENALIETCK